MSAIAAALDEAERRLTQRRPVGEHATQAWLDALSIIHEVRAEALAVNGFGAGLLGRIGWVQRRLRTVVRGYRDDGAQTALDLLDEEPVA